MYSLTRKSKQKCTFVANKGIFVLIFLLEKSYIASLFEQNLIETYFKERDGFLTLLKKFSRNVDENITTLALPLPVAEPEPEVAVPEVAEAEMSVD